MKVSFDQVIALVLIVGCLVLILFRIDGEVKSILTMAAGWAFGSQFIKKRSGQ